MKQNTVKNNLPILTIPVFNKDMAGAISILSRWITNKEGRYVCAADVHSIMRAQSDTAHLDALQNADMVTPDGRPLVWIGKLRGEKKMGRVCGPDLLPELCRVSVEKGWKHYFYGGAEGVAETLAGTLSQKYPGIQIAGWECPPFKTLSQKERDDALDKIRGSGAAIVWVGLGCPKQEIWMRNNVEKLDGQLLIGIGAAFDFHTGKIKRAPVWMQNYGLEWFHRLSSEPARLWKRYILLAPQFVAKSLIEALKVKLKF